MKILNSPYLLFILLVLLVSCKHENVCSDFEDKVYKYPLYTCIDSVNCWENLKKSLQLPDQYLTCSSSDSLAITCFSYPLLSNIWLYSSIQEGFNHVRQIFNGFEELFNRTDKNRVLIKLYQDIDPLLVISFEDPVERGEYMTYIIIVEIAIAQYEVVNYLTLDETKSLLEAALKKYYDKSSIPNYSWIGEMSSIAVLGRILYARNYIPFVDRLSTMTDLNQFIDSCDLSGINNMDIVIQTIISDSENYLNELKN